MEDGDADDKVPSAVSKMIAATSSSTCSSSESLDASSLRPMLRTPGSALGVLVAAYEGSIPINVCIAVKAVYFRIA